VARVFDFGIGITAEDEASSVIQNVIQDVGNLRNSLTSMSDAGTVEDIMGGWDPTALIPAEDALDDMRRILGDVGEVLVDISKDTEFMAKALGRGATDFAVELEEVKPALEQVKPELHEVTRGLCAIDECADKASVSLKEVSDSSSGLGKILRKLDSGLGDIVDGFADLVGLVGGAVPLGLSKIEHESVRLNASLGQSRDQSMEFARSVTEIAESTGLSTDSILKLQTNLAKAGLRFDETTEAGRRQIETYAHLQETYKLGAEETQRLAGAMHAMGNSVEDLAGVGRRFEKEFQVPGIIATLPEAADAAMDAQAQFGSLVGRSSRDIMVNIQRMTGVYARALGTTAANAADKARQTFMHFQGEIEHFEDLFLGLEDDVSPMQRAFLETGMSFASMEDMIRMGAEAPMEFAQSVLAIRDQMDPQMGQRFFRQILRASDETTRKILTQQEILRHGTEQEKKDLEELMKKEEDAQKQQEAFNNMISEMRRNAVDAFDIFNNLLGVFREEVKLDFADAIQQGLTHLIKLIPKGIQLWRDFSGFVRGTSDVFEGYGPVLSSVAGALRGLFTNAEDGSNQFNEITGNAVAFGVGLSTVAGAAGVLVKVVKPLWKILKGGGKILKSIGKHLLSVGREAAAAGRGAGAMRGSMKALGVVVKRIAVPLGIAIAAFDNVKEAVLGVADIISDPNKTGFEKFEDIVGEVLGAVWGTFDDFFLGLPGKFVEGFNNVGRSISTEGAEDFGKAVGDLLGNGLATMVSWFSESVIPWFRNTLVPGIQDTLSAMGTGEFWKDLGLKLLSGFAAIGDQILAFFSGLGEGFVNAFSVPLEGLKPTVEIIWLKLQKALTIGILGWVDTFMNQISTIKLASTNAFAYIEKTWETVTFKLEHNFQLFVASALSHLAALAQAVLDNAAVLGITVDQANLGVDAVRSAANAVLAAAGTAREEHENEMERIEDERAASQSAIIDEIRMREAATDAAAADFDRRVEEQQEVLNKLAEQRAEADAAAAREAMGIAAREDEPGAETGSTATLTAGPPPAGAGEIPPMIAAPEGTAGVSQVVQTAGVGAGGGGGGGATRPTPLGPVPVNLNGQITVAGMGRWGAMIAEQLDLALAPGNAPEDMSSPHHQGMNQ